MNNGRFGLTKKEQRARDREYEVQEKVEELIAFMNEKIALIKRIVAAFEDKAVEAALAGKNDVANWYTEYAVDLEDFADDMEFSNDCLIQQAAITMAFAELGNLNSAIKGLKKLLASGPNIQKILESRESLYAVTKGMRAQFKKIHNDLVRPSRNVSNRGERLFSDNIDPEYKKRLDAKRSKIESKVAIALGNKIPATPDNGAMATASGAKSTTAPSNAEIDDILKTIESERGK